MIKRLIPRFVLPPADRLNAIFRANEDRRGGQPTTSRIASRSAIGKQGGFTLIEVTLAMGIIVVSLVTMMGLIPVGLNTLREAMDGTIKAQIVQAVGGRAMLTPFSSLGTFLGSGPFYFDDQGIPQTAKTNSTRFAVTVTQGPATYPGSDVRQAELASSVTALAIKVQIVQSKLPPASYAMYIPNNGG